MSKCRSLLQKKYLSGAGLRYHRASNDACHNKEIKSKEDVIKVARIYFSRWKIEEYFRCKKQMFQFENSVWESFVLLMHLIFISPYAWHFWHDFNETRRKCPKGFNHKTSSSYKRKSIFLLLPTSKRHSWHTIVCKRRRQAMVPDKTSGISSTLS